MHVINLAFQYSKKNVSPFPFRNNRKTLIQTVKFYFQQIKDPFRFHTKGEKLFTNEEK